MTAPSHAPRRRPLQLTLLALWLTGCSAATAPPRTTVSTPSAATTPPEALHWVRSSTEYRAAALQAYALAGQLLDELTATRERGSWAVVLDADETILDNSQFEVEQRARSERFSEERWHDWCLREEAGAVPGAIAFLEAVRDRGGRIAIVTNRRDQVASATASNLRALGAPFDVLLPRTDTGEKEPRWRSVEEGTAAAELGPLEIVLWIGDNIKDFPDLDQGARDDQALLAPFGKRWIILPNPLYGSWQETPFQ